MDYWKALNDLATEKARLDRAIAMMEMTAGQKASPTLGRRGMAIEQPRVIVEKVRKKAAGKS